MLVGHDAKRWFSAKYGETKDKACSSKYYLPEESWPKKTVWWMKIPSHAIGAGKHDYVNILCQITPSQNDFHYLKVPVAFFHEHFDKFHRIANEIDLYLSAEPHNLFREIRGVGNLDFSKFLVRVDKNR